MDARLRERVEIGKKADGKPEHRWACGRTTKELHDAIVALYIKHGLVEGLLAMPAEEIGKKCKLSFESYVSTWLSIYKSPKLKPTTLRGYESMLSAHLYPVFGNRPINEISTDEIQKFLNDRANLAQKTLKELMNFLSLIFADALEDEAVTKNPMSSRKLTNPSDKKSIRKALEKEQVRDIINQLSALEDRDRKMMALLLLTGMRRGEVLGLRWEDIRWNEGKIYVERNVTFANNQPHIGTPKTEKGKRKIPLDPQLKELLQPIQEAGFIVGGDNPISHMMYTRAWQRITKQINVHGATAHVFRHSYLTAASNAGVDMKTLQSIGGHADINTTMNRYVHTQDSKIDEAGKLISLQFAPLLAQETAPMA